MKTFRVLWMLLALVAVLQAALFFYRGLATVFDYTGYVRYMWLFKMLTYVGILVLLYSLLRILQAVSRHGFSRSACRRYPALLCPLGLIVTLTSAVSNACMHLWEHHHKILPWIEVRGRFFVYLGEEILDRSLLGYVLILSLLLLSAAMRKKFSPDTGTTR